MSLRFRLSILVAVAIAPPLVLTAYNTYGWRGFLEAQAGEDALASARLVAAELTQLLEGSRHVMLTLAKHPAVPDREEECSAFFKAVVADLPIYLGAAVVDRDAKFHCSSIPIRPTLDVRDRVYFYEPLQTGRLTVGALTTGRETGVSSIHVSIPYRSTDGRFDGIVVLILNPEKIADEFAARSWQADHRVTVFDRNGAVVLSIPPSGTDDDSGESKRLFEQMRGAGAGSLIVRTPPGKEKIVGFVPLKESIESLTVAVGIDREVALAQAQITSWRSIAIGLIAMALGVFSTWLATHILIRRPVLKMVDTARRRAGGDVSAHFPRLRASSELGELSTALASMSDKVDHLLEQKEFLLRELQHRVMNSLNILSSLLMLQGKHTTHPAVRDQLARAQERILAMGAVYRHLYSIESTGSVEFGEFLKMICGESERAYIGANRPTITCETEPIQVSGNQATSLAVLAHELITNALKHAYPESEPGPISVRLRRGADGAVELSVSDRGRGVPADLDVEQPNSLGFKVIMATVRQFGGALTINRLEPGAEFLIHFPPGFGTASALEAPDAA